MSELDAGELETRDGNRADRLADGGEDIVEPVGLDVALEQGYMGCVLGVAVVLGLVLDLIVTYWLEGFPSAAFWVAWPVLSLIILVAALVCGALRRLFGPVGVVLTLIVLIQLGNPSSGGANGAVYLPGFWHDIGPFLPPRNALDLMRNTLYFDGNGILQPLLVLLAYAIAAGVILGILDLRARKELTVRGLNDDDMATAGTIAPVGPPP